MLYLGVDHHMKTSHLTITDESGQILKRKGIATRQDELLKALEEFQGEPIKAVLEASYSWGKMYDWLGECSRRCNTRPSPEGEGDSRCQDKDRYHRLRALAEKLISSTCEKQGIKPGQLGLHADRGPSMKSKPVEFLLVDLGVDKTHSRPHTSNDNPYSESQFKTLKYRPEFPKRFGSIQDARSFGRGFFSWYNTEHRHSGIAYLTPEMVHYGHAKDIMDARQVVLLEAYDAHPERFVNKKPRPLALPAEVWINKPERESESEVVLQ